MWAVGRYDLQLTDAEFWDLTYPEFEALYARHKARLQVEEYHSALICSVLANINRDRKHRIKPFSPRDFMSDPPAKPKPQDADPYALIYRLDAYAARLKKLPGNQ